MIGRSKYWKCLYFCQKYIPVPVTFQLFTGYFYLEQIECVDYGHGRPGLRVSKMFVINVTNINEPPFDISLNSNFIKENSPVGQVLGELSAEDVDSTEVSFIKL